MTHPPKPPIGTRFSCTVDHLTKLNSNENACRAKFEGNQWILVPPENKSGLIVFIRKPPIDLATLQSITITEVGDRVAFAEPSTDI